MLPILHLPPVFIERTLKPGATFRYRAESVWEPAANGGPIRESKYDLTLLVLREVEVKSDQIPEAERFEVKEGKPATFRMEKLESSLDGQRMPTVRLAGVFGVRLSPAGMPREFSMEDEAGLLGLPLLSWYLPPTLENGTFEVPAAPIAPGVSAEGEGRVLSLRKQATFRTKLWIGPDRSSVAARVNVFEALTTWDLKTGRLITAEGTLAQPAGTLRFKIDSR